MGLSVNNTIRVFSTVLQYNIINSNVADRNRFIFVFFLFSVFFFFSNKSIKETEIMYIQ